jgi:DNA-binding transcriptional LysR family regulator
MINRGGEMEIFVRVVEHGSFSATARALRLTPSAISKLISRLEQRLGVSLILRSTRGLQLTPEGEVFFDRAQRIVSEIEQSERAVSFASEEARGTLRVNSNIPFAQHYLLPIIPGFLEAYPGITLDLVQTDLPVDLIYERADVAIRTGHLSDSALKARKLMETPRHVVVSQSYLDRFGRPRHPTDLERHNCLNFNIKRSLDIWPFDGQKHGEAERLDQAVKGNLRVSDGETMRRMAMDGVGIARLSEFHIGADIASGALIPILEDFNPGDTEPVQALFVDHAHMANRIRVFIDYVTAALSEAAQ